MILGQEPSDHLTHRLIGNALIGRIEVVASKRRDHQSDRIPLGGRTRRIGGGGYW